MLLSVMPMALRVPMVDMLRKSIIRRPEIILNPATTVISNRIISTLKSIRSSQLKIWGYLFSEETAVRLSSSSVAFSRAIVPAISAAVAMETLSL